MAAMRSSHRRSHFRGSSARRKLVWSRLVGTTGSLAANGIANFDLLAALENAGTSKLGVTVMRTLLDVQFGFAGVGVPGSDYWVLACKRFTTSEIAAVVDPAAQMEQDWAFWGSTYPGYSAGTVDSALTRHFDLRSRRKIDEMGETYGLACTNKTGATNALSFTASVLLMLP